MTINDYEKELNRVLNGEVKGTPKSISVIVMRLALSLQNSLWQNESLGRQACLLGREFRIIADNMIDINDNDYFSTAAGTYDEHCKHKESVK